jgi:hypothetical protein
MFIEGRKILSCALCALAMLADPATPPAVRANLQRLVAQIEAEAEPHRFSGHGSMGLLHDSNVNAGPASAGLSLDPSAVKRSDSALTVTLVRRQIRPFPIILSSDSLSFIPCQISVYPHFRRRTRQTG